MNDADPFAEIDPSEEIPLDQLAPEHEPAGTDTDTTDTDGVSQAKPATTQPVVTAAKPAATQPTTQPALATTEDSSATGATSEKKAPGDAAPGFTVTELPIEEVKPDAPPADDNK
jgi:hypothetical protein